MLSQKRCPKFDSFSVLIVIGLLILSYLSVQYGTMLLGQEKLERQWMAQQQATSSAPLTVESRGDGLTRLLIPKLNLSAVVVEGTGYRQLLRGPGHMSHTATPGDAGNSVITAHRDTFFRHLAELKKGDEVLIQRSGVTYAFEVMYEKIVKPTEISVTEASRDTRLTMITCYPIYYIGPAPERLVVVAKLVRRSRG